MSDLTSINGIGPATASKLADLGIKTLEDLASQDNPADLAELVGGRGVTAEIVAGWIAEANGGEQPKTEKTEPFGGKGDHDGNGKTGGAAPATIPVRINRDFWDANGERHRKGNVIEVSVNDALDGVESGALSRVR